MRILLFLAISLSASLFNSNVAAQIDMPQPSPLCTLQQKVGLMDVTIIYSRPSARGRKVFGDLVQYNKLWRTGANMASRIQFSDSVFINNTAIPKGEYSILSIPGQNDWTIILNKQARLSGTSGYNENEDAVRVSVKPESIPFQETFTIGVNYITNNSAFIEIMWETTKVAFKIETNVDYLVLQNIERALRVNPVTFYQAARYYYETNRDLNQALEWINESLAGNETFWVLRQKALIQAKIGDFAGAIETANRSSELSQKAGNSDYVRMNNASIAEWSKK
jgi:hypothetical protein